MESNPFLESEAKSPESPFRFIVMLIGTLLIFGGVVYSAYNLYQILTFEQISAKVASIGETQNKGKMPATIYEIWVGFDLPKQIVYTSAGKFIFYNPYKKGDVVTVYYNPKNPNEAFIHTFATTWFIPVILLYLPGLSLILWMLFGIYKSFFTKILNRNKTMSARYL